MIWETLIMKYLDKGAYTFLLFTLFASDGFGVVALGDLNRDSVYLKQLKGHKHVEKAFVKNEALSEEHGVDVFEEDNNRKAGKKIGHNVKYPQKDHMIVNEEVIEVEHQFADQDRHFYIGGYKPSSGRIGHPNVGEMFDVARHVIQAALNESFLAKWADHVGDQVEEQFTRIIKLFKKGALLPSESQMPIPAPAAGSMFTELQYLKNYPSQLIYDQGNYGSCTANAFAWIVSYLSGSNSTKHPGVFLLDGRTMLNPDVLRISRLYQYYITRLLEARLMGMKNASLKAALSADNGASMAGAIMAADKSGSVPESCNLQLDSLNQPDFVGSGDRFQGVPYIQANYNLGSVIDLYSTALTFALNATISGLNAGTSFASAATQAANPYHIVASRLKYVDLTSDLRRKNLSKSGQPIVLGDVDKREIRKRILASIRQNRPIYIGVLLNDTFLTSTNNQGFVPMINLAKFNPTGGHAVVIVGYGPYNASQPEKMYYKFVNSWGSDTGNKGYYYFPADYIEDGLSIVAAEAFSVWFDTSATSSS